MRKRFESPQLRWQLCKGQVSMRDRPKQRTCKVEESKAVQPLVTAEARPFIVRANERGLGCEHRAGIAVPRFLAVGHHHPLSPVVWAVRAEKGQS